MAMGVSTQGNFMPSLALSVPASHVLRFTSTPTFYLQGTRLWSSSLQCHSLTAQNSHFLMAEDKKVAVNGPPLMSGEAKITNIKRSFVAETEKASNRHHVIAGVIKVASNCNSLVDRAAKDSLNGQQLPAGSRNCEEVKRESNGNKMVAINGHRQGNSQQKKYLRNTNLSPMYVSKGGAYSQVLNRGSEYGILSPELVQCNGLEGTVFCPGKTENNYTSSSLEKEYMRGSLQAGDGNYEEAKRKSNGNKMVAINGHRQGNLLPKRQIRTSHLGQGKYVKEGVAYSQVSNRGLEYGISSPDCSQHNGLEGRVLSPVKTECDDIGRRTWSLRASDATVTTVSSLPEKNYSSHQNSLTQKVNSRPTAKKGFAATNKVNTLSPFEKETEMYRTMSRNAARIQSVETSKTYPASGSADTSSQHDMLHTIPASDIKEISYVSKTGYKDQKASSEKNSLQEPELECTLVDTDGFHLSLGRQVVDKEKIGHNTDNMSPGIINHATCHFGSDVQLQPENLISEREGENRKGKRSLSNIVEDNKEGMPTNDKFIWSHNIEMDDLKATSGIDNEFVETKIEKLPSELKDDNWKEGGSWGIRAENEDTFVMNNNFTSPSNSEVSASNQVFTGVSDCKGTEVEDKLDRLYKQIFIVDNVKDAKMVVGKLMGEYRNLVHACDTEVADIDVKTESPVGHGKIICFSVYCGLEASFGDGKSCVWVDVLDGGEDVLSVFAPYFEDPSIRKVLHNYSFDRHILGNHGINVCGFYADTMHLARLWNSARREEGGYSLEALTMDPKVMNGSSVAGKDELIEGKMSMKILFGKRKIKKDGSEGKTISIAPVEELQKTERMPWICYSALDSISTWRLWKSLQKKLKNTVWIFQGDSKHTMYDFYEEYWRPFGELLVQMESRGMLVDRDYLSKMEEVAIVEQEKAASQFKSWAATYCPDAKYMNVGSGTQVRQLLFGGSPNKKDLTLVMPNERSMKVPNVDNFVEEGKKVPGKFRNITLRGLGVTLEVEKYTVSGWPAVSSAALRAFAGKVSVDYSNLEDEGEDEYATDLDDDSAMLTTSGVNIGAKNTENKVEEDLSVYGTAYKAFGGGKQGKEACHAFAALCEVSSINTLISNFLQPLQGNAISGADGRVHCSLNINTETGRLSARKPNLQNQPALEKDRYKIRQAFIANPGNSLIVADYGQLELRILAHLSNCKSMLDAFKAGGDFHSRTAMNMYPHVRDAVEKNNVLLEWDPQPDEEKPPIPLLKDVFATERRKAKMLNFSIAYGKTAVGLSKDWKVTLQEAKETVKLWYNERKEVLQWQEERKHEAQTKQCVYTLLGRARHLPCLKSASFGQKGHIERAAINTPVQGSAADVAMCAMLEIARNVRLKELGWTLLLQVHDEVILEGPIETAEEAKSLVVDCMSYPFYGKNILQVDLAVDAKYAPNWYAAK
ncbi:DNA polymerase I B, chloroplastic/mitochondrial isoform X2 [Cryptomeria japonica]|uniref:DNA polymerase I B, chloroplastic/mitochondrial isoform X2 n=1 Tax=Cryptomeria japonica TaxID=3369 RepID=UPI0027DA5AA1|nr:DNA polymerase I B, chloroplastic/mitochondrial isoform X2 [Cryptomeria japonica]